MSSSYKYIYQIFKKSQEWGLEVETSCRQAGGLTHKGAINKAQKQRWVSNVFVWNDRHKRDRIEEVEEAWAAKYNKQWGADGLGNAPTAGHNYVPAARSWGWESNARKGHRLWSFRIAKICIHSCAKKKWNMTSAYDFSINKAVVFGQISWKFTQSLKHNFFLDFW